jgi:hypothetical protein
MKVKIGKYPRSLRATFYEKHMNKKYGLVDWPKGTKYEQALEWLEDRVQDFYNIFNRLWFWRQEQKVSVRIDPWDTWSVDGTLAHIILPMLRQLKETKNGAPEVADEDVPEDLRSTNAPPKENAWDTDKFWFVRWDWVLDEMIFAFEHKIDDSWEDVFYSGERDIHFEKLPSGNYEMKHGPKHTLEVDWDGINAVRDRMSNGFRLFGKYYENLWD